MELTTTGFIDKAIYGLKKAAVELEEFQLQLALGKTEASDKYEEMKKKFNAVIRNAKEKLNEGGVKTDVLKRKFEELQLQLTLGKAETKEVFNEQKDKILKAIQEIENLFRTTKTGTEFYLKLTSEIEKFKIKMEILRLRFELEKLDVKDELKKRKEGLEKKINEIKQRFIERESTLEKNWNHFCNEMSESYTHLKKAFVI